MAKQTENNDFLSAEGRSILSVLLSHCKKLKMLPADSLELEMLANSFDVWQKNAKVVRDEGAVIVVQTKTGPYPLQNPAHSIMTKEYQNILKHSAKFGLNPGDREKIFKGLGDKEKGPDFAE